MKRRDFLAGTAVLATYLQIKDAKALGALLLVKSAPWTPLNLGSALVAWWDASDTANITFNGSNVSSWVDKIGGLAVTQATGANQPVWSATARNGKPGLTFNGTSSVLNGSAGAAASLPQGTTASTIMAAAFLNESAATNRGIFCWGVGGTSTVRSIIASGVASQDARGDTAGNGQVSTYSMSNADTCTIWSVASGAAPISSIGVDGNTQQSTTIPTLSTGNGLGIQMGAYAGGVLFWLGVIQQIMVFNRVLTIDEYLRLSGWESWADGKAGVNLPLGHPYKNAPPTVAPLPAVALIPGIFNYNASYLNNWRAGRSNVAAGASNTSVLFIGDSTTAGFGSTPTNANALASSFPAQLAPLLNVHASWQSIFGNYNTDGVSLNLGTFDSRVVQSSFTTTTVSELGALGYSAAGAGTFTFTPTQNVDTFNFYYQKTAAGGSVNLAINGGANTPVSQANASNALGVTQKTAALGASTLDVAWASGTANYLAVVAYNSSVKEVSLLNAGWIGAVALSFDDATQPWSPLNFVTALAPSLTFIDLTINDGVAGTNLTTFGNQIQAIITAAKALGDVVLMTGVPNTVASVATQLSYVSVIRALAVSNNCVCIDFTQGWGTWALANANGWMFNNEHPNAAGYLVEAQAVAALMNAA